MPGNSRKTSIVGYVLIASSVFMNGSGCIWRKSRQVREQSVNMAAEDSPDLSVALEMIEE